MAHREIILEAARQLFAEKGLGAEMREIAEHAGVGVGSIYRHFDSREGLDRAVKEAAGEDLVQRLHVAAGEKDPKLALREMIDASAGLFERFGVLTEVMLRGRINELPNQKKGAFPDLHTDPDRSRLAAGNRRRLLSVGSRRCRRDRGVRVDLPIRHVARAGIETDLQRRRDAVADFFLAAIAAPGQS